MSRMMIFLCAALLVAGFTVTAAAAPGGLTTPKTSTDKPAPPTPVPEPLSIALLGGGLLGLYGLTKKFDKD